MKNKKFAVLGRALTLSAVALVIVGCGGGGGSAAPASVTPTNPTVTNSDPSIGPITKFEPGVGKLIPQVRTNGYSASYQTDANRKAFVDALVASSAVALGKVGELVKWPFDIPAVFSGCGTLNAFFGGNINVHLALQSFGASDPAATFGDNIQGATLIMCHEFTEANADYFLKPTTIAEISSNFSSTFAINGDPTLDELTLAFSLSTLLFEWQVMFHELGHGLDQMLLKDADNAIKNQFRIPLRNTCNSPTIPCDTIGEDFADWISSLIMVELLKIEIAATPANSDEYLAALFTALGAWEGVFGAGSGAVHSKTESRQVNMVCYAYGAIQELRVADANSGNKLGTFLAGKGVDIATCETSYTFNENLTGTLLAPFVKM